MASLRGLFSAVMLLVLPTSQSMPQSQSKNASEPSNVPTIQVTSRLVFLDVTVLDKEGNPVVKGLSKDDFTITENKKPQRIFSFEAPQVHTMGAAAEDDNPDGEAPVTIFVLDLLNSQFVDFAFIRYSVRKYLDAQPPQLSSPAEMMVIGNNSLEVVQGYTRSKEDLLFALDHIPATLPYKMMNGAFLNSYFVLERFAQSIDALQQIALQSQGVPGRKNVLWVGQGGPNLPRLSLTRESVERVRPYLHQTANMLVDARISLFVLYPGKKVFGMGDPAAGARSDELGGITSSQRYANLDFGNSDPFAGDVNFGVFVNETGGKLFFNNDVDAEIRRSQLLGSEYYTLTYQPHDGDADGKFRRVRVILRDRNLKVITKTGYFASAKGAQVDPRHQMMVNLSHAARSDVPFTALDVKIAAVVRHPDSRTAELTVVLNGRNLDWQASVDGKSTAQLTLAAASLTEFKNILSSRVENLTLSRPTEDRTPPGQQISRLTLTIPIPRKTRSIRVVVGTEKGGRIGGADLDRKAIDAAPETPTPNAQLLHRQQNETPSTPANP
jgi:VWFA-related protein